MEKFLQCPVLVRHFETDGDFGLPNVGYNDFHTVRPAHSFYMQKNYTWHFVLSGRGTLEIGDRRYHLAEGDMFFIPPDTRMRYYPADEEPWEYVWFTLRGEAVARYGALLGFSLQNAAKRCEAAAGAKRVLRELFEALLQDRCGYFGVLSAFYRLMEICSTGRRAEEIQSVKRMIDDSFSLPSFSIDQLCRNAGISHAQLLRRFKRAYGVTMIAYVLRKRIELACELLETTDLPIRSIAFSCGFADEIHFMKCFKRERGLTATAYRKSQQGRR
ncbi:MAG: AraC family transcriptional regulator [Ruminococcaceae bacterium]|nr:AraC family transcriptional regulator [Oscillospiraceae bacterium]